MNTPKGTTDIAGDDARIKRHLITIITHVCERYGYEYLETPSMELRDVLTAKFSGGELIEEELFTLTDRGERPLALRYDHTVPLARYITSHPELALPYKRYTYGSVFRDGPIKAGRKREFTQVDADIVGANVYHAEYELIGLASHAFDTLNIPVRASINHRILLETIIARSGITLESSSVILTLDKIEKIGKEAVIKELEGKGAPRDAIEHLFTIIASADQDIETLRDPQTSDAIDAIVAITRRYPHVRYTSTLARGLNYYSGLIYEFFTDGFSSSIAAGGRYHSLITQWTKNDMSAAGISFGIDAIMAARALDTAPRASIHIIPIGTFEQAYEIAHVLRTADITCSIDTTGKNLTKNIKYALAYGHTHVLFVGEKELESEHYTLRNLTSGEETSVSIQDLIRLFHQVLS